MSKEIKAHFTFIFKKTEEIINEYDRFITELELEKYTRRKSNHI